MNELISIIEMHTKKLKFNENSSKIKLKIEHQVWPNCEYSWGNTDMNLHILQLLLTFYIKEAKKEKD